MPGRSLRSGDLRHRITIQENTGTVQDVYGVTPTSWTTHTTAWAAIDPRGGSDTMHADQLQGDRIHRVVMRWQTGIKPDMRVVFAHDSVTRYLEIIEVNAEGFYDHALDLVCRETEPQSMTPTYFYGLTFGGGWLTMTAAAWTAASLEAGTGSFTVEAWVKLTTSSGTQNIINHLGATGWRLVTVSGKPQIWLMSTGSVILNATSALTASDWTHVAMVVDRSAQLLHLYIDGVEDGTGTDISTILTMTVSATANIGAAAGGASKWTGSLTLIRYVLSARTAAQVAADMLIGPELAGSETFWPFYPGSGTSATEFSGGPSFAFGTTAPTWGTAYTAVNAAGPC